MEGYDRWWPRAADDARYEARRAGLFPTVARYGDKLLILLYAYNRIAGTIDVHENTLTFPDPAKPVLRGVYPGAAVRYVWDEVRRYDPPAEPWQESWKVAA